MYKTGISTEGVENCLLGWPVNEVPGSLVRGVTSSITDRECAKRRLAI